MSDYLTIPRYALLTDDIGLAVEASSLSLIRDKYLPLINMPRIHRPDWLIEIQKRMVTLQRAGIKTIFTKNGGIQWLKEYFMKVGFEVASPEELLESLSRDNQRANHGVIPKTIEDYFSFSGYRRRLSLGGVEYLTCQRYCDNERPVGNSLLLVETSSAVLDVCAINYARYFGYDLKFIPLLPNQFETEFEKGINDCNKGGEAFEILSRSLRTLVASALDFNDIQNEYEGVQLIVGNIPIGIFIEDIPAAHLFQVDAELKLLSDITDTLRNPRDSVLPSYLFVDLEENGLQSEIPEVVSEISKQSQWRFHLNGKRATVTKFKLFCEFFPFDFLTVSGHGGSPDVRIAEYEFKDENGNPHIIKVREFYQFLRVIDGKVEVETKEEFLAIDGVNWEDKKAIDDRGLSIKGFLERHDHKLISSEEISVNNLEGLVLSNGIFMGNIHHFANFGNPVLFLNTCGSLANAGKHLSFAGARAIIGTAWSIYDPDAVIFSREFFPALKKFGLARAFFEARKSISNSHSQFSYWFVGTLNGSFKLGLDDFDLERQKGIMAARMISALEVARAYHERGWMAKEDIQELRSMLDIATEYCRKSPDVAADVVFRINNLRAEIKVTG